MTDYLNVSGRIFDIQKFSVHDGPGIRTIVFLKGCALRCKWCCNPESQKYEIQTMIQNGKEKTVGRDVTVSEVIETVKQDMPYYRRSGGGMTLSGGEMLCQSDFAYALLRCAKEAAINTAVETTGFAPYETIEKLLPYIDTVLMDIKHTDSEKHKAFTTQPNERILANAVKIAENARKLIIRVPVIPTFNDTEAEIASIAKFASTLKGVDEINLLPYHSFGRDKYVGLGREYLMGDIPSPTDEHMKRLKDVVERYGLKCNIGG
ncbi:MAG: glycyl-radical enzyme activating protein [Clostridia bacterium]|jgi:pyruvate formate lyase activating enzyme|nr:glycyl-radical enzyme activating protein [Clostridia bacterium]